MTHQRGIAICLALSLIVTAATTCTKESSNPVVDDAVKAAGPWLATVDSGDYGMSWDQSAGLFRDALTRDKWDQALQSARKPLGPMVSREVKSTRYATSLPGAPDGEYVVIQFAAEFARKKSAVETVTSMRDPDGVWRVSGYFIK